METAHDNPPHRSWFPQFNAWRHRTWRRRCLWTCILLLAASAHGIYEDRLIAFLVRLACESMELQHAPALGHAWYLAERATAAHELREQIRDALDTNADGICSADELDRVCGARLTGQDLAAPRTKLDLYRLVAVAHELNILPRSEAGADIRRQAFEEGLRAAHEFRAAARERIGPLRDARSALPTTFRFGSRPRATTGSRFLDHPFVFPVRHALLTMWRGALQYAWALGTPLKLGGWFLACVSMGIIAACCRKERNFPGLVSTAFTGVWILMLIGWSRWQINTIGAASLLRRTEYSLYCIALVLLSPAIGRAAERMVQAGSARQRHFWLGVIGTTVGLASFGYPERLMPWARWSDGWFAEIYVPGTMLALSQTFAAAGLAFIMVAVCARLSGCRRTSTTHSVAPSERAAPPTTRRRIVLSAIAGLVFLFCFHFPPWFSLWESDPVTSPDGKYAAHLEIATSHHGLLRREHWTGLYVVDLSPTERPTPDHEDLWDDSDDGTLFVDSVRADQVVADLRQVPVREVIEWSNDSKTVTFSGMCPTRTVDMDTRKTAYCW